MIRAAKVPRKNKAGPGGTPELFSSLEPAVVKLFLDVDTHASPPYCHRNDGAAGICPRDGSAPDAVGLTQRIGAGGCVTTAGRRVGPAYGGRHANKQKPPA